MVTAQNQRFGAARVSKPCATLALVIFTEHVTQPVGNLTHRCVDLGAAEDMRHQVVASTRGLLQALQPFFDDRGAA